MSLFEGILFLGVLIVGSKVFEEIFVKLRQPGILGNVLAGLVLGPSVLAIVRPTSEIELFISLGIFFLFFLVGVEEIDITGLISAFRRRVFYAAAIGFIVPFSLALYFSTVISLNIISGLVLSAVIGLSSLGVAAKVLSDMGRLKDSVGLEIFSIAAVLEFVGLMIVGVLLQLASGPSFSLPVQLSISLLRMAIFLIIAGLFSFKVMPIILRYIRKHTEVREVLFGVLIGIVLLFVYFGEINGVHGALTALIMGIALSRIPKSEYYQSVGGLRSIAYGIFVPIFFAGIGLHIGFEFISLAPFLIIGFILVVVIGKFAGAFLGALVGRIKHPLSVSSGVMAKGAIDLALMLTLLNLNLIDRSIFSLGTFSILLLLVLSPSLMHRFLKKKTEEMDEAAQDLIPVYARLALGDIKAENVMSNKTFTVSDKLSVSKFVKEYLNKGIAFLNVVNEEEKFVGHISAKNLKKLRKNQLDKKRVTDIMRRRKVKVFPTDDIYSVVEIMASSNISLIPVVDPSDTSKIIGTISRSDIMKLLVEPQKTETNKREK
ncbi:MAG: cation:proton antiporter [Candidatus Bathyarchaeota archaeon]